MKAADFLRLAVLLEWAFIPLGIWVGLTADRYLPPELLEIEEKQFETFTDFTNISPRLVLWMILAAVMLTTWVVSTIGLFKLRKWGAWLYLASTILHLPFYFMIDFEVNHAIEIVLDNVRLFTPGFIIGLAFFSDAIPKSNREQDIAPTS